MIETAVGCLRCGRKFASGNFGPICAPGFEGEEWRRLLDTAVDGFGPKDDATMAYH